MYSWTCLFPYLFTSAFLLSVAKSLLLFETDATFYSTHVTSPLIFWHFTSSTCTSTHARAIFILRSERKQITVHYHRLRAHKNICAHKGAGLILASTEFIIVFYGAGRRRGGLFCSAARDTAALFVRFVRKEAPVRSIHPLRRFPAECDVRVGKWAGLRILLLLWIWHELGPRPLRMWWMYYLIFLSLLTSLWLEAQWFCWDETTSPVWPLEFDGV